MSTEKRWAVLAVIFVILGAIAYGTYLASHGTPDERRGRHCCPLPSATATR